MQTCHVQIFFFCARGSEEYLKYRACWLRVATLGSHVCGKMLSYSLLCSFCNKWFESDRKEQRFALQLLEFTHAFVFVFFKFSQSVSSAHVRHLRNAASE